MDPDANLKELREAMHGNFVEARTRELFDALDIWLCRGGFLPHDWMYGRLKR